MLTPLLSAMLKLVDVGEEVTLLDILLGVCFFLLGSFLVKAPNTPAGMLSPNREDGPPRGLILFFKTVGYFILFLSGVYIASGVMALL